MTTIDKLKLSVQEQLVYSWEQFNRELSTDENKDYRRGFLAGMLCSRLQLKSDIGDLQDASTQQSTR